MSLFETHRKMAQQALERKRKQVAKQQRAKERRRRRLERMPYAIKMRRAAFDVAVLCATLLLATAFFPYDLLYFFEEKVVFCMKLILFLGVMLGAGIVYYITCFHLQLEDACTPSPSSSGDSSSSGSGSQQPPS
jgi:cation transport ATPase